MFCKHAGAAGLILAFLAAGCSRQQARKVERLAVLPLDNLSSDAQLNWFSHASAAAVQYDLAGAKRIFPKTAESIPAAQGMQATRALEGYFFERAGRIWIRATLEDLRTSRTVGHFELDGPMASGFVPLANELARRVDGEARSFGTTSESAFRFYGEALEARDLSAMDQALESAKAADPGFAAVYLDEARLLAQAGGRDRAEEVVHAGERARLDAIDRAELGVVAASISGSGNAQMQALETLARLTPANASLLAEVAGAEYNRRDFARAAQDYRGATALNPDNPQLWNQLGYAVAWTGDLNGARQAIERYRQLAPEDANAFDSLGEVSYFLGDFESATKYFEQAAKAVPAEFLKAAEARLMVGDLRGADGFFAKYMGARGGVGPAAAFQMAQWEFLTGRRAEGVAGMEKLAQEPNEEIKSRATVELAIWGIEARESKPASFGEASSPVQMLLAGRFRDALPELRQAYEKANPSDDAQARVMLAWALVETGGFAEAGKLLAMCPLPLTSGDPMFASLIFPRYFALRAAVFEKQGKADEAKKNRELYAKYGGAAKK